MVGSRTLQSTPGAELELSLDQYRGLKLTTAADSNWGKQCTNDNFMSPYIDMLSRAPASIRVGLLNISLRSQR